MVEPTQQNDEPHGGGASAEGAARHGSGLGALTLGALGVVYGDIGTSPLYMIKEAFGHTGGLPLTPGTVYGALSTAFWALMLIVTIKYVLFIMAADNRGEGGVLALATLAMRGADGSGIRRRLIMVLAIAGAALFYGDGLITPAISVLSAVEGLEVAAPALEPYVVPLAVAVLVALFLVQQRGTHSVGRLFGPVMLVWFSTLGLLGLIQIVQHPEVLVALNPQYAFGFFANHGGYAFAALGAIVLAVTGAEALYADMGHFGRKPIRIAWFGLVLPALVMNYFGQGALLITDPHTVENPFFLLAPSWALYPLVGLSTLATVIASQAVISGVFSLTRQAIQLGYLPRLSIRHTSATEIGQIYIPQINWLQMTGVLLLVVSFGSSSALASAYGIAVTGAMSIDAVLAFIVAVTLWRWPAPAAAILFALFLVVDLAFFGATALKIPQGGWMPLMVAAGIYLIMSTWRRGRAQVYERLYGDALPLEGFINRLREKPAERVAGTAVFMTGNPTVVPQALLHNLKHNKVLHERIVAVRVNTLEQPFVDDRNRVMVERLGGGFHRVIVNYGFLQEPDIPRALERCRDAGLHFDMMSTSFFLSREKYLPSSHPTLNPVQEWIFIRLAAAAVDATEFFGLPPNRVVELGAQVEI
ncbi:MAG TPA: potassium transporter Kup [Alphaproteobacteria bacterium]|nr:potassium transporter Kup [Alphaproteobacteria bacterium]